MPWKLPAAAIPTLRSVPRVAVLLQALTWQACALNEPLPPAAEGAVQPPEAASTRREICLDREECWTSALALRDAGKLAEARAKLLVTVRLAPASEPALEALQSVEDALHEKLLRDSRLEIQRGRLRSGCEKLRSAARLEEGRGAEGEAEKLLKRYGYQEYEGEWIHRDDLAKHERLQERLARKRMEELQLGPSFHVKRRGSVRIFTDFPGDDLPFPARKLHGLLDSSRRAHADLFLPLLPGESPPPLDMVVFQHREDYEKYTASPKTVGMFLPAREASFFFLGGPAWDEPTALVLHEICHQLDFKALGSRYPPPWLQEGLAVCFEGATVSREGVVESIEELPRDAVLRLRKQCPPGSPRWWGVRKLAGQARLDALQGTDALLDFYAQAALLVHLLLEGKAVERAVFYEMVERARDPSFRPDAASSTLEAILLRRGESPESLEQKLQAAARALGKPG
jgi:hypothetical protein